MERMLMAVHAKDTLEMLEEMIEILICSSKIADQKDIFAREWLLRVSGCKKPSGVIKSDFKTVSGEVLVKCLY